MPGVQIGSLVRLGNHLASGIEPFKNAAGAATNPTAVVLTVVHTGGAQAEYAWPTPGAGQFPLMQEVGQAGRFYGDVLVLVAPRLYYRLAGAGVATAAAEGELLVEYSSVGA